ncbi:MAG: iron-containing alcohol dehydrogenase [Smithella sp.]
MLNGIYSQPTTFYFGRDSESFAGEAIKKYSGSVLLHYGQSSIKQNGIYNRIKEMLNEAGLDIFELGGVMPNPRVDLVYQGIDICRQHGIKFILAVGGGSVIDSAKAISIGVLYDGDFYDYFKHLSKPEAALPVGVILTLPGSGSESNCSCVITDLVTKNKLVCESSLMFPVFSILNPEFTTTIPRFQTSCSIIDALSHIFERYFSNTGYVDCTDRICEGLMSTLINYAVKVLEEPKNYDIRAEIMWACKLAHDNCAGFGRKQDWGCHKIGHELGAYYDLPHGAIMGVLFLAWFRFVSKVQVAKLAQLGRRVIGIDCTDDHETATKAIDFFEAFLKQIGMPVTLREIGIHDASNFAHIAKGAIRFMQSGTVGNYVRLAPADIVTLLENAY